MSIQDELNQIKNAVYGADVRDAIHDSIKKTYDDASANGNANMEVEMARGSEPTLNDRLGKMDDKDESLTAQLAQTATKNEVATKRDKAVKLELEDMSETTLGAMSGTASFSVLSTPQDGSVKDETIHSGGLSPEHIRYTHYNDSGNLFDKTAVITGGYYQYSDGTWVADTNIDSTEFIPVEVGSSYISNWGGHLCRWDENKNYISGINSMADTSFSISDSRVKYVTKAIHNQDFNKIMFVKGSTVPDNYVKYQPPFELPNNKFKYPLPKGSVGTDEVSLIDPHKLSGIMKGSKTANLFDKNAIKTGGYYDYANGNWVINADYAASPYIQVEKGQTYRRSATGQICYLDINGEFVEGYQTAGTTFTVPTTDSIFQMTFSVPLSDVDTFMLVKGETLPEKYIGYSFAYEFASDFKFPTEDNLAKYQPSSALKANPHYALDIQTYPGGRNQPTHPKVLYFANGFNGYKYWMAYTPYPNNNYAEENPCISYSTDGLNWSEEGISNPISSPPTGGYNSDTHLVYANGILECWWREVDGTTSVETIVRKTSTDGINWNAKEILFTSDTTNAQSFISPSVIYDESKYKIWVLEKVTGATPRSFLKYYESNDGLNWALIREIDLTFEDNTYRAWHFDVVKTSKGFEFVGSYQYQNQFNVRNMIIHATSQDNVTYTGFKKVLTSGYEGNFDSIELYRPCLIRKKGGVMLYYGANGYLGNERHWGIGLVTAPSMAALAKLITDYEIED